MAVPMWLSRPAGRPSAVCRSASLQVVGIRSGAVESSPNTEHRAVGPDRVVLPGRSHLMALALRVGFVLSGV